MPDQDDVDVVHSPASIVVTVQRPEIEVVQAPTGLIEVDVPAAGGIEVRPLSAEVIEIIERGPQGDPGPPGPLPDWDAIFAHTDTVVHDYLLLHPRTWTHQQNTAVFICDITHPLDHRPTVVFTDTAGDECDAEVAYPAPNRVLGMFNQPWSGTATLI